jgi:hypothetical protein
MFFIGRPARATPRKRGENGKTVNGPDAGAVGRVRLRTTGFAVRLGFEISRPFERHTQHQFLPFYAL